MGYPYRQGTAYQESVHLAVTVQKRVYGLEWIVYKGDF